MKDYSFLGFYNGVPHFLGNAICPKASFAPSFPRLSPLDKLSARPCTYEDGPGGLGES